MQLTIALLFIRAVGALREAVATQGAFDATSVSAHVLVCCTGVAQLWPLVPPTRTVVVPIAQVLGLEARGLLWAHHLIVLAGELYRMLAGAVLQTMSNKK